MRQIRGSAVLGAGRRPLPPLPQAESREREDKRAEPPSTGYWGRVWSRLRRDPLALCGGVYLIFVFLMCFVAAPILVHLLGHWLGLELLDAEMPPDRQRRLVRGAGAVLSWRGTKKGLECLIELVFGVDATVASSPLTLTRRSGESM